MSERKTIRKWWWVWALEKEEEWLNNKSRLRSRILISC